MSELTTYQQRHLAVTFDHHAPRLFGPMVEASKAHVIMLTEQGLIPAERGQRLLRGLRKLTTTTEPFVYDGTFEDVYFLLEKRLAAAAEIDPSELDVQLARSRNDLDSGVFRMILRADVLAVIEQVLATASAALRKANEYADVVIVGYTHRRPAQPTTIGHALTGYAEALAGEAVAYVDLLDQLNTSPLGSCAFAGTDLDINPARVAELLGFDGLVINSYEAVAGADHLVRVGTLNAQTMATGARLARTFMDWLTWRWVVTPDEFCQGSSIMPQKRNPVVLEHMVSMAGATAADAASVLNNVGAAWWEDSNNATTDVQTRLWDSCDRTMRFFAMMARFIEILEPLDPPSASEIVMAGATTTSAADALSRHGVPFRTAHSLLGRLIRVGPPPSWTAASVREAAAGIDLSDEAIEDMLTAATDPSTVLNRAQIDGPGAAAVRTQLSRLDTIFAGVREKVVTVQTRLAEADRTLQGLVDARAAQ